LTGAADARITVPMAMLSGATRTGDPMSTGTPCCPRPRAAELEQFEAVSTLFDAAEMVLYVADMDTYELLFMNAHAERIWGNDRIGERCYRVLQKDQEGPCTFCTNPRLFEDNGAHPVVWEFQNTRNDRWYLCIDKAIPWPGGRRVRMEVAIDVTERKLHEQFREQYVALISHDLRTPISTIVLSATMLKLLNERAGCCDQGTPQLESILRNASRLAAMIEDLLETTRLESGQIELHRSPFDLAVLAGTVCDQLAASATRSIRCEYGSPAPVLADAGRIERVLENLIGNALRYSPPDTPVQVTVENSGREATVAIADFGVGIPADELPQLFQRFARATGHDAKHGLGLGLYNSRLIIEQHGGRIWADSALGAGSTFTFSVPTEPVLQPALPA
jgi:two-component system, OmpR family, phosphate regulon sensor histidine kinase PhoR